MKQQEFNFMEPVPRHTGGLYKGIPVYEDINCPKDRIYLVNPETFKDWFYRDSMYAMESKEQGSETSRSVGDTE